MGPKKRRKRPKLESYDLEELTKIVEKKKKCYTSEKDTDWNRAEREENRRKLPKEKMLEAGQSKRIWDELYKVVDASDVILEVVDARDPMGTRTTHVEEHIKKNCPHKHVVIIINKCDLVPIKVTASWVKILSAEYPTVAFKASVTNPFGKATLIQLLKQFDLLHKDKKTISIGFVGYPNVGKSSVINTLKKKGVCKVAPIPGETKVWQYVALTKRIYLIDCPGIVYDEGQSATDIVLKGVVRAEKIENPEEYIDEVLKRVKAETFEKLYNVRDWVDGEDFLKMVAERFGKLKKGGEPHLDVVARMILNDWQRGKILYFVPPPVVKAESKEQDLDEIQPEVKVDEELKEDIEEEKANPVNAVIDGIKESIRDVNMIENVEEEKDDSMNVQDITESVELRKLNEEELMKIVEGTSKITTYIKENVEEEKEVIKEIVEVIEEPKDNIEEKKCSVEESKEAIEQAKETTEEVKETIEEAKGNIESAKETIEEAKEDTGEPIEKIKETIEEVKENIKEPKNSTEKIKETISEVKNNIGEAKVSEEQILETIEQPKESIEEVKIVDEPKETVREDNSGNAESRVEKPKESIEIINEITNNQEVQEEMKDVIEAQIDKKNEEVNKTEIVIEDTKKQPREDKHEIVQSTEVPNETMKDKEEPKEMNIDNE